MMHFFIFFLGGGGGGGGGEGFKGKIFKVVMKRKDKVNKADIYSRIKILQTIQ